MSKKGLSYNAPPARCPHPPDLHRFPEIQALVSKEHVKRMADVANGRAANDRVKARAGHKYRNKGKKG